MQLDWIPFDAIAEGLFRHKAGSLPFSVSLPLYIGFAYYHRIVTVKLIRRITTLEKTISPMSFPLKTRSVKGYQFANRTFYLTKHVGTDYEAVKGTDLFAPFDGTVVFQGKGFEGGNTIWFKPDHDEVVIRFMHLDGFQKAEYPYHVNKGEVIAHTGNTGFFTTGSHLHIDISRPTVDLDKPFPGNFIDPETYNWDWQPEAAPTPSPAPSPLFLIEVKSKLGSAYFRDEPKRNAHIFAEYPNGTKIVCNGVVEGETVNGSNLWYRSRKSGKFIHSSVSKRI